MTLPVVFTANGPTGYNLTNSLRFRSSASAYLNRTPASAGNLRTWTWSGWVKRGRLTTGSIQGLFAGNGASNIIVTGFRFTATDNLEFISYNGGYTQQVVTTQVFRDPSAWYHLMAVLDTTQATASNRAKIYVNGQLVTALSTATYPSQNYDAFVNTTNLHVNGAALYSGVIEYLDGYMAEVNFIDGQALTPSSFGSTNALTGVWQPARYTGTYGTNGFYLPFTDNSALTTSSNVGLGKDFSGNGNYWTTNNISITAGATYDSMTDVPTLTSATTANYAVLNPLSQGTSGNTNNGNLSYNNTSGAAWNGVRASFAIPKTGEWYWEAYILATPMDVSIVAATANLNSSGYNDTYSYSYGALNAAYRYSGVDQGTVATYTAGDTIAYYINAGVVKVYKNNTLIATWSQNLSAYSGDYFPAVFTNSTSANNGVALNFGQQPFKYTPPSNAVALNTFNLPNSTIVAGNKQMDATTYTGTGSALTVTNSGSMQPDLVWIKSRSVSSRNTLFDSIRGITKVLWSDSTDAEGTATAGTGLTAFSSNGFTLGTEIAGTSGSTNSSGVTYVGWQWKAGGTAVTNTAGSITSQVSANTTSGFSVVTWVHSSTTSTIGHGLGVAPSFIILKSRTTAYNWDVGCNSIGWANRLILNSTGATTSGFWNSTAPTSSVFTYAGSGASNGDNMVAYCFAQIAGYSAFGSYTGNGSADGPFVYTGFRPRFVLIKLSSAAGANWEIYDSARNTSNATDLLLLPSSSSAEGTFGSYPIDLLSNGFKIRGTGGGLNDSGQTLIYACFAENPFKYALAR